MYNEKFLTEKRLQKKSRSKAPTLFEDSFVVIQEYSIIFLSKSK